MPAASPTSSPRSWRRRVFNRYTGLALAVLAAAGGYALWHEHQQAKNSRDQYQIVSVQRGDLQDLVTATGTVQPRDYVDVGAQVSGQLKKLHVEVGSIVSQGDLLAEIDPTVLTATADARRAGLRNLRATLTERESQAALALIQYNRQKNLMAEDATTQESLQQAEAALRSARAQIESIKAQIEQSESQLRADEANLNYAKIYAPMSGTVVSVSARQGQTLNANQSAPIILRVADLSTMTVQTQVSEADVSKLRQGMEVYFTTLGSQGRRWYGSLRKVEPTPTVTNNVVLYNALFDVDNRNQQLMTNMTAQVFFVAASAQDVLMLPVAAVNTRASASGGPRSRGAAASSTPVAAGNNDVASGAPKSPAGDTASRNAPSPASAQSGAADAVSATAKVADADAPRGERRGPGSMANMSPEERRAAFERMSPEERAALRERRRAEGGGAPRDGQGREDAGRASVRSGFGESSEPRSPRRGTVKVIDSAGKIEERQVELGVSNRVQIHIISGVTEGEQVIAGTKPAPGAGGAQRPAGGMGAPGMGAPGMGAPRGR